MEFTPDKVGKKIKIKRCFDASRDTVWAAWTQSELLDQWWAPKPWKTETKSMNFSNGGQWLYAMVGPDGTTHWSCVNYEAIHPKDTIRSIDAFCDENGNISKELPVMKWFTDFKNNTNGTCVNVELAFANDGDMDKILEMGFKEGFEMGLNNLEELLVHKISPKTQGLL
jgi:uncharacterized protein YndB with AHSA1/START domain